jgi:hypothetical protein
MDHHHNSFETMDWFDTLDDRCKLEAILAGHVHPSPQISPSPIPVNAMNARRFHSVIIVSKGPRESPLIRSYRNRLKNMAKSSHNIIFRRPNPVTPSRYRSPSPETICCGLVSFVESSEIYA